MSYIDKNSNIVVSARMTNEGRRLLSLGQLTFDTFRMGDSEIDYKTLGPTYDITFENVIRAKAENPDIKTPLLPASNSTNTYLTIPTLSPVILETVYNAPNLGFFLYNTGTTIVVYTANTDTTCHILQTDSIIPVTGMTGTNVVPVRQATTYGVNLYEPKVGDLMMVKMNNDELVSNLSQITVELTTPVPYLWYQVQSKTGTLAANNLQVTVDRDFANFPTYGGSNYAWATFYPLGTGTTKDTLFSDGGFFSGGCVWNMNNVWSYPIPGVNPSTYETYNNYGSESYVGSKEYFGYTSEAVDPCGLIPSISIVHYSNKETCDNQTELKYGQKFYVDATLSTFPKLIIPSLMWHKNYNGTMGQSFSGNGTEEKFVTLSGNNTTIGYYDLVDEYGNEVGRTFPELQMFTLHDQELVAALSYKSNRNWTLPTVQTDTVANANGVIDSTENLYVTYLLKSSSGYTTGLHCQNIVCVNFPPENCPPTLKQAVNVQFPVGELPFMGMTGGTGWYADTFYILAQKQPLGTYPDPTAWNLIDYTSSISSHIVGTRIDPTNLEASTFTITGTDYSNGTTYNLNNFITIPQIAQTNNLQFGDERFFYGNTEAVAVTDKYRTKFVFMVPPTMFNNSTNPTWANSNQSVHISEVGVYDVNKKLVAVGKMNLPIEKVPNATIIIEIAFDL